MNTKRRRWMLWITMGALAALLGGQVFSTAKHRTQPTVTAVLYTGPDPIYLHGVIVRDEISVVANRAGDWALAARDGEKVAAGQALLIETPSPDSLSAARSVRILRGGMEASGLSLPARRDSLRDTISRLSNTAGADRIGYAEQVAALLLGENENTVDMLTAAEDSLLTLYGKPRSMISAPQAGVFSAVADGLETVLTPEDPWALCPLPATPSPENVMGRLILSDVWYVRVLYIDLPDAPVPGDTLEGVLLGGPERRVTLTLEEIHGTQALLSCETALEDVASLREIAIKILPESEFGVEIPAETVYTVGEQEGVWCLVGEAAVFKPITVIHDLGTTLVVELDQSSTAFLWPGDQILRREPD